MKITVVEFRERVWLGTGREPKRGFWNAGGFFIRMVIKWVCLLWDKFIELCIICAFFCR